MIICGIKLTHDGAIALIDGNRLVYCHEMEKIRNGDRYSTFNINFTEIKELLKEYGYKLDEINSIVIDGWTPEIKVTIQLNGKEVPIELADYGSLITKENILTSKTFDIKGLGLTYHSYLHISGHILGAYCTSPFAARREDSYVLIWDGGMYPQLFYYRCETNTVENLGVLFLIIGNIYSIFAQHFGPFRKANGVIKDELSIAGKVMAYIALGAYNPAIVPYFREIYTKHGRRGMGFANVFTSEFAVAVQDLGFSDEDILHTFHAFLETLLTDAISEKIRKYKKRHLNLCFAGGCALNIKWNSAIRSTGIFREVWVPPFPNDSGSAIGTACCEMVKRTGDNVLEWSVYSGPSLVKNPVNDGWQAEPVSIETIARLLHEEQEPVIFLTGRAELGPRALGNRSIIGAATSIAMKNILNRIKDREPYRPVAPICIESDAPEIFDPGSPDSYMLFDHQVRAHWKERIPAICHLDGSARLQTVSLNDNAELFQLLKDYKQISGIPVLCNTSANFKGKGFFPDVASAVEWGKVNYVWGNGILYTRKSKTSFRLDKAITQVSI